MSRVETIREAMDWLGTVGDQTFVERSYAEVVRDVARQLGLFRTVQTLQAHANQPTYAMPASTIQIDQVIWYPDEIPETDSEALDLVANRWDGDTGTPVMWLRDLESANRFRLYPKPMEEGELGSIVGNSTVLARVVPTEAEIPEWLEGVIAMLMAAREAKRLGTTQDLALANALHGLVQALVVAFFTEGAIGG